MSLALITLKKVQKVVSSRLQKYFDNWRDLGEVGPVHAYCVYIPRLVHQMACQRHATILP